ncbi:MAG: hypothetical protein LBT65_09770, partial [Synergistaceae bacterium]|nr:hypothetical protein [Synergistaceae bacterium]
MKRLTVVLTLLAALFSFAGIREAAAADDAYIPLGLRMEINGLPVPDGTMMTVSQGNSITVNFYPLDIDVNGIIDAVDYRIAPLSTDETVSAPWVINPAAPEGKSVTMSSFANPTTVPDATTLLASATIVVTASSVAPVAVNFALAYTSSRAGVGVL